MLLLLLQPGPGTSTALKQTAADTPFSRRLASCYHHSLSLSLSLLLLLLCSGGPTISPPAPTHYRHSRSPPPLTRTAAH
jgi:hypothetical protein